MHIHSLQIHTLNLGFPTCKTKGSMSTLGLKSLLILYLYRSSKHPLFYVVESYNFFWKKSYLTKKSKKVLADWGIFARKSTSFFRAFTRICPLLVHPRAEDALRIWIMALDVMWPSVIFIVWDFNQNKIFPNFLGWFHWHAFVNSFM